MLLLDRRLRLALSLTLPRRRFSCPGLGLGLFSVKCSACGLIMGDSPLGLNGPRLLDDLTCKDLGETVDGGHDTGRHRLGQRVVDNSPQRLLAQLGPFE